MKINKELIDLIQLGFSMETLKKLNENQVNILHKKLVVEQYTTSKTGTIAVKKADQELAKNLAKSGFNVRMEGEIEEEREKNNPWSICTAQMGKEFGTTERSKWTPAQEKKYERCVKGVKKSIKEGKEPLHYFNESENEKVINEIEPRITKKELLEYLNENIKHKDGDLILLFNIAKKFNDPYEFDSFLDRNKLGHNREHSFLRERFTRLNRGTRLKDDGKIEIFRAGDSPIKWGDYVYIHHEDAKQAYDSGQGRKIYSKLVPMKDVIETSVSGEYYYSPRNIAKIGKNLIDLWNYVHER